LNRRPSGAPHIGCGNGALAYDVAGKAGQVIAIDKSSINIQTAQMNYARENIEYITGDATRVTLKDNFDVIILSNVLEHIEERVDFLAAVKKYAPKILLRVPMLNRDWITLYKKELGIEWRLDKTHFTEYTVESLLKELSEGGVELIRYSVQFGEIWGVAKQLNQD
jgi:2-polyprenyl-3-methyl-5-hydroxy-6-metoxy-1,4-benzoquinol methylase